MARGLLFLLAAAVIWAGFSEENAPARVTLSHHLSTPKRPCGATTLSAPAWAQRLAMQCMINRARTRAGLRPLGHTRRLTRSAGARSREILRCDSFSHNACGRAFASWARRVHCRWAGENIAWGTGQAASVRAIFRGWMRSPSHRRNILGPFRQIGIGMQVGTLAGVRRAHVWTQHFGSGCGRR